MFKMKKDGVVPHIQVSKLSVLVVFFSLLILSQTYSQEQKLKSWKHLKLWDAPISEKQLSMLPAKGPYFVIDDRIIEDRWMIERFVVPLEKYSDNPVVKKDLPWEGTGTLLGGTVLFDTEDNLFKMYYTIWNSHAYYNKLPFSYNIAYAESKDGMTWEKPTLDLFDLKGSIHKKNNIIKLGWYKTQSIDVELNPTPKSSKDKFVAIHNDNGGVFVSYSEDGKEFNCSFKKPAVWYHSDTHNNLVYDEVRNRWFMFVRPRAYAGEGLKHVNRRRIAVKESDDLVNWTHDRTVMVPEEDDVTDFYGLDVFRRGDLFFGFLKRYDAGKSDKVSSEMVWSNNAYQWFRLPMGTERSPIGLGKQNEWDAGQVYLADKPVIKDDEMLFYYGGNKTTHNEPGNPAIGLAKTKLDRLFGARSLPGMLGRILTRPFEVKGDLFINADAEGEILVEVRSAIRDEPLEGWSFDDCTPFAGSELNEPINWGDKKLSDLKGKMVRLRFQLKDGTLYSFNML
ncbi:MAG: hypothetical protein DRI84_10010 [Bacteroidetes bacterium]|nr:MAG: hypothetical protein DRI84_10010 [Bacteroidota bacterium]